MSHNHFKEIQRGFYMITRVWFLYSILLLLTIRILSCTPQVSSVPEVFSVKEVMDQAVTRLYATMDESELA